MNFGPAPSLIDGKLPVFVFPSNLTFYTDDQTSHKQILTLYNPYDFALKFKVFTGNCSVVRHKDICMNNEGLRDKFRIHVFEQGQRQIIGKKDVSSILLPRKLDTTQSDDNFESLGSASALGVRETPSTLNARNFTAGKSESAGPSWVIVVAAALCIVALMLPIVGDSHSTLPDYLQLSVNQKLIAAYVLGLVTMAIMRS